MGRLGRSGPRGVPLFWRRWSSAANDQNWRIFTKIHLNIATKSFKNLKIHVRERANDRALIEILLSKIQGEISMWKNKQANKRTSGRSQRYFYRNMKEQSLWQMNTWWLDFCPSSKFRKCGRRIGLEPPNMKILTKLNKNCEIEHKMSVGFERKCPSEIWKWNWTKMFPNQGRYPNLI